MFGVLSDPCPVVRPTENVTWRVEPALGARVVRLYFSVGEGWPLVMGDGEEIEVVVGAMGWFGGRVVGRFSARNPPPRNLTLFSSVVWVRLTSNSARVLGGLSVSFISSGVCPDGYGDGNVTTGGADACVRCGAGFFSRSGGPCRACGVGSYSAVDGATGCRVCEGWTFASRSASTGCVRCGPGSSLAHAGAGAGPCVRCGAGRYSTEGVGGCTDCDAGTFSGGEGWSSCAVCGAGTWTNGSGASACLDCPRGATTGRERSGGWGACQCKEGYMRWGEGWPFECVRCGEGLVCNGTSVALLATWRVVGGVRESLFVECRGGGECVTRSRGALPCSEGRCEGGVCARGRRGERCDECDEGGAV